MRLSYWSLMAGLAGTAFAAVASAEVSLPFYNRAVRSIDFVPDRSGAGTVVQVEWLNTVADRGYVEVAQHADLVLEINGSAVSRVRQQVVFAADPSGCSASDACAGCSTDYSCYVGVPGAGCACGKLQLTAFPPQPLQRGDRVQVRLVAAPGSVAESFLDDDRQAVVFPTRNRAVERVSVHPHPGGTGQAVKVDWSAFVAPMLHGLHPDRCLAPPFPDRLPLDVKLLLEVNGRVVETAEEPASYVPTDAGCNALPPCSGAPCGSWGPTFTPGRCRPTSAVGDDVVFCACSHGYASWFKAAVQPGDRVRVTLAPARGSAGEQFAGDDSGVVVVP